MDTDDFGNTGAEEKDICVCPAGMGPPMQELPTLSDQAGSPGYSLAGMKAPALK